MNSASHGFNLYTQPSSSASGGVAPQKDSLNILRPFCIN